MQLDYLPNSKINFMEVNTVYQDDEETIQDLICKYDNDFNDMKKEFEEIQKIKEQLENGLNKLEKWYKVYEETSDKDE